MRKMRKLYAGSIMAIAILLLSGCGKSEENKISITEDIQFGSTVEATVEKNSESETDVTTEIMNEDTMYVYSEADRLKDYNTVDALLNDTYALVKVKVLQADSANVRSYIYTTYNVEIMDVLYGDITESRINVNMPGGIIAGEAAQKMISEVTEGKDAGDLSNIGNIVSDGDTDRLLEVGDEAYLFLIQESDTAYAVVGEYNGEVLLESENVLFDNNIVGFQDGVSAYGLSDGSMSETDFIELMEEMISNKN
ncbi:MAG: hypothetical protein NC124_17095 [Clostridium sp.]|nr:hypothetical protein [Clostridium sp.]MCM1561494.1 hypothetical protein [Butyrivibrio sp.]